jgi:aspartate-semialdehyde dehydrogenase
MSGETVVAVVGATGAVGRTMLRVLEERDFPVRRLLPVASVLSAGALLRFRGAEVEVLPLAPRVFDGCDIALFSAGGALSAEWAPVAAERGALVIDNSSHWRMHDDVPLVVPEVNAERVADAVRGIIANPNCSTIQLVVALKPLYDAYGLRRVVVDTYQAVSGAGQRGIDQLTAELSGSTPVAPVFAHAILPNALPHIAAFRDDGFTTEERKLIDESRKILGLPDLRVAPTCVRVPVPNCHSEAVHVEFERAFDLAEARALLAAAPGIVVMDDPAAAVYPLASIADGRDDVFVGRLRRDNTVDSGLSLWIVADNLRKGAATNAVQIAETWLRRRMGVS